MWLLKTEPGEYSYEDLEREGRARWDGVRNPVALRNLRAMKQGERVLVYHTGSEKAVVGEAVVAKAAYPDPQNARLAVVDLEPRGRLAAAGDARRAEGARGLRRQPARPPGTAVGRAADGGAVAARRGARPEVNERLVVLSTVANASDAERISRALVEQGLAACVNLVPGVVSIYRWQGEVQKEQEFLLVIKTRAEAFERLRAALVALHPYEVPELVAWPIAAGHEPYLSWIDDSVTR